MIRSLLDGIRRCAQERRLPSRLLLTYVRLYRFLGKRELRRRGYLDFLQHRPPHAFPPDYADLWFLYRLVRRRRPSAVLEFGSGCSTVILGYGLRDNGGGTLYSVDADPHWTAVTKETLPEELRGIVKVTYSPVQALELYGVPGWRHVQVPDVAPDFLYLDGPPLSPERAVAVDPLDIEDRFPPGFVLVVDGRKANVEFLMRFFQRSYRITHRKLFINTVFELDDGDAQSATADGSSARGLAAIASTHQP